MIRTLIVDDVPLARDAIRVRCQEHTDVEIVGEAGSGAETLVAFQELNPDLVFLDVHMPDLDAFALLKSVEPAHVPLIVFVTAHDRYAVKAFEANAIHFLLKPVDDERFAEALQRARKELSDKEAREHTSRKLEEFLLTQMKSMVPELVRTSSSKYLTRLAVPKQDGFVFVRVEDVDWMEAAGNYVRLHSGKQIHIIRMILSKLEAQLDPEAFTRISRSTLVNISRVQKLTKQWHGDFDVFLHDGTELRMSRRYRRGLIT
jgi:two-component system LytT family response regulator